MATGKADWTSTSDVNITNAVVTIAGAVSITSGSVTITSGTVTIGSGDVDIYVKSEFFETATYYDNSQTAVGAVTNMYDSDSSTIYKFATAANGDTWVKWDFGSNILLKTIYVYIHASGGGGTGNLTIKLQGSDNDTDWTDLRIQNFGAIAGTVAINFLASNKNYRYFRVIAIDTLSSAYEAGIYYIKGVV